jgi:hypothetical protein
VTLTPWAATRTKKRTVPRARIVHLSNREPRHTPCGGAPCSNSINAPRTMMQDTLLK